MGKEKKAPPPSREHFKHPLMANSANHLCITRLFLSTRMQPAVLWSDVYVDFSMAGSVIRTGKYERSVCMKTGAGMSKDSRVILLVDDEIETRKIFSEVLRDLGHDVIDKPNGASALEVIRQGIAIDLVITDYRMPDMTGLDLVMTLRQVLPAVPVIMMTAHGDIENYFRSLSLGVFEYVNKPVGKREFEHIVQAALHGSGKRE